MTAFDLLPNKLPAVTEKAEGSDGDTCIDFQALL